MEFHSCSSRTACGVHAATAISTIGCDRPARTSLLASAGWDGRLLVWSCRYGCSTFITSSAEHQACNSCHDILIIMSSTFELTARSTNPGGLPALDGCDKLLGRAILINRLCSEAGHVELYVQLQQGSAAGLCNLPTGCCCMRLLPFMCLHEHPKQWQQSR